MNQAQEIRSMSWMISFGMCQVPESVRNAIPNFIKNDTPSTGQEGIAKERFGEEVRKLLLENIELALKENITDYHDIWEFLLSKQEETGQKIIIRNRSGSLMALTTFRDYVLIQKRVNKVKKPSFRDQILDLHRQKFTEAEMQLALTCSKEHIHRCLVDAGLKSKKGTRNRIYKHKKAY